MSSCISFLQQEIFILYLKYIGVCLVAVVEEKFRCFGNVRRCKTYCSGTRPQSANILAADLTITAKNIKTLATCRGLIYAEDVDDGDIPTSDSDWDDEVKTAATVDWNPMPSMPTVDVEHTSPDFKATIQEIVDRAGWASGNAIVIFLDDADDLSTATDGTVRFCHMYDSDTAKAPKMDIDFSDLLPGSKLIGQAVQRASVT